MNKYPKGFLSQNLEVCRAQKTCQGGFEGEVKIVRVISHTGHDWGYWTYSDQAIQRDKKNGFTVLFEGDEGFEPEEEQIMLKTSKLKGDESKIFFSGCLHIFHKQSFIWQKRGHSSPDEHAWKVLEKINETVGGNDTLFLLGDTFLNVPVIENAKDWLNKINCQNIILLYGNHSSGISQLCKEQWDKYNNGIEYYPVVVAGYNKVVYGHYLEIEINGKLCVLSHFPFAVWNKSHHGSFNLHSHNHGTFAESLPDDLTCKRLDVGWDVFARPVSFKEIREIMDKKKVAILDHHNEGTN